VATIQSIEECPPLPVIEGVEIRNVDAYPGYAVGSDGSVWSCMAIGWSGRVIGAWRQLEPHVEARSGYVSVTISARANGGIKRKLVRVHQLVCTAFHGNRPEGMEVCHFPDRTRTNNSAANLRWGTRRDNSGDAIIHGTSKRPSNRGTPRKLTADDVHRMRELRSTMSLEDIARDYKVNQSTVSAVCTRRTWSWVT
jgi:hypothetical protein